MERSISNLDPTHCPGGHRFFVAADGSIEAEGKVFVVVVCTACSDTRLITHIVAKAGSPVTLQSIK